MRIELSMTQEYWHEGTAVEGIREMIQNARDGEIQYSAPMSIKWRDNKLIIINEGVSLPHEALLLGHSSKRGNEDLLGCHGEGLKIGTLALLRAGYKIKIRSGSEVWVPGFVKSEKFKATVLAFNILGGRKGNNRIQVEISDISKEDWEVYQKHFLFLMGDIKIAEGGYYGNVILDPEFKGKIYVKGIFVQHHPNLKYGYDLHNASLDRDRKILASYDLEWRTKEIWAHASRGNNELTKQFISLLSSGEEDVKGFNDSTYTSLNSETIDQVAAFFQEEYGDKAVPVDNLGESEKLDHFGKQGIIVPKSLRIILEKKFGGLQEVTKSLESQPKKYYSWHELTDSDKESFNFGIKHLDSYMKDLRAAIDIVDFNDKNLQGIFNNGKIQVAHKLLGDKFLFLKVLLHEVAHQHGGDGEKDHVAKIEEIWCNLFRLVLSN